MLLAALFAGVFGLILGSFFNVVAHRLPRGESLATPASRCPSCETPVRPRDNVPVLGWLLLRGRCRSCGVAISKRYPLVESGTGLAFAAVALVHYDDTPRLVLGLALVAFLVPIALIDLDHRLIPNKLTLPAAVVAIAAGLLVDADGEPGRLLAGVLAGGFFLLAALAYPKGMGMGDVKLAGVLGLFLGAEVAVALLVALVSGVAVGGIVMARVGAARGRKTAVPFGPFLALGGLVAVLAGVPLVDAYLDTFA